MQYSVYVVSESSNTVVVCAILIGTSDLYNTVRLSTISSTAGIYTLGITVCKFQSNAHTNLSTNLYKICLIWDVFG